MLASTPSPGFKVLIITTARSLKLIKCRGAMASNQGRARFEELHGAEADLREPLMTGISIQLLWRMA
jgi:hypothetical protein